MKPLYLYATLTTVFILICLALFTTGKLSLTKPVEPIGVTPQPTQTLPSNTPVPTQGLLTFTSPDKSYSFKYPEIYKNNNYDDYIPLCEPTDAF